MSTSVISVEWLNQNSLRNYPFREDCGMRPDDSAGTLIENGWSVPTYLVSDFVLGVDGRELGSDGSGYDPTLYMKRMSVVGRTISMVFADSSGEDAVSVSASSGDRYRQVAGVGSFSSAVGTICFGDLDRFFDETPEGLYRFSIQETLVEPSCIRPSAVGVSSIALVDASGYTTAGLRGDVKLVAGDNINLKYDVDRNAIIVSADPNSGYTDGCACDRPEDRIVRSINGISTSDVTIVGDECFEVTTEGGIITISDKCSKPCCGCAETAFINQAVNDLQSSVNTLSNNASILNDRINSFVSSYLLARKALR